MVDQPLHEKIEAYLLGQLPPEEAAAFEKQIEGDPELAEEVELHRLILPVYDRLEEIELHNNFDRWQREMDADDPPPPPRPTNRLPFLLALALLLIGAGAFLLWRYMEGQVAHEREERQRLEQALIDAQLKTDQLKQENEQLQDDLRDALLPPPSLAPGKSTPPKNTGKEPIAAAAEPEYVQWADEGLMAYADNIIENSRTRGGTDKTLIEKAATSLRLGQYREAAAFLRAVKQGDPMYSRALEMLAYTQFKRKQYTEAVNAYKKYREYNRDTDQTDWELCLFYLADYPRYKNELRTLLNGILSDPKHPKHREASGLMAKMEANGLE